MKIRQVPDTRFFCVEHDDGAVWLCPCCGSRFATEAAAQKIIDAIDAGQWSWEDAKRLQKHWAETA